ncbi:Amidohydrolase [Corynebacterium glyciniphilum AJ 3170]|uniref:Amidohydrolase n=1 Tax=Corynebacterium glyciniphilum AJ 3170 TaxID=1404245 RepID=X5E5L6_9CORY|nr:amidohydrolase [Corynebacterium glyciniphilum]AHW62755.1 Amidohydrolase [Corynebacterium glyciniphilum AJ 3170]
MTTTIYTNATVFTADTDGTTTGAFAVTDGKFSAVGSVERVREVVGKTVTEVDLRGRFIAPGIIDSHTHLASFGTALGKAQLRDCQTLGEIQDRLLQWLDQNPGAPRVLGGGWLFDSVGDTHPTAAMLDEVLPDIPVYLDANDLHSTWVNSAALREAGIDRDTPNPVGGEIARNAAGEATGLLYETAGRKYARDFLERISTPQDHVQALELAFDAYLRSGVTSVTDMALTEAEITALRTILARDGRLPFPITGHVLMVAQPDLDENEAQVSRTVDLRDELSTSGEDRWFRIAGVKFIMDGVIDAKTATMCCPYADGTNADPIWDAERMKPVAATADAAGLQIAMHAIGDRTSEIAIEVLEHCAAENRSDIRSRRHRVEHLETVTDDTIRRMAELGTVASMQPVHSDPAIMENWKAVLGDERQERGFPWHKFRDAGIPMTLGTDAPTAPHEALPNLYIALTGGSSLSPSLPPYHPERAFTPAEALTALTAGGAYAGHMDSTGQIRPGFQANFIELDVNPLEVDPREILEAEVVATYVLGERTHTSTTDKN